MKIFFNKIFGQLKMSWLTVILFAVITGCYTGAVMLPAFLEGTSFQDIGVSYEWWVVFAVIVVVNCKKNWEAMLKCFIFFLISQPLVYLVQIAVGYLEFRDALMYYRYWFILTILTLPGGFIAFYCKKQNVLGAIIMGLGNTIEAYMAAAYFVTTFRKFPYHLLTALFCVAAILVMTFSIQKEKKNRIIALAIPVVLLAAGLIILPMMGRVLI